MKKFIAPTMKDALEQMKKELGEDAVILSTRTIPLGSPGAEIVEVIASNDAEEAPDNSLFGANTGTEADAIASASAIVGMRNELIELRRTFNDAFDAVRYRYAATLSPRHSNLYKQLRRNDMPDDDALRITGRASAAAGGFSSEKELFDAARSVIASDTKIHPPLQPSGRSLIVAFTGTTGSGKTTVIAKLAAVCKLVFKTDVLIVSADTYKVGGAEQLQTFAAIAGIPFRSAYSAQELRQIMKQPQPHGIVLIDTVGRSQRNSAHLNETAAMLEAAEPDTVYLVQSAVVSEQILTDVLHRYKQAINPSAMILTKTDEASALGQVYASLRRVPMPLAYFSTGQNIPDDLEPATADGFARLLLT